MCAVRVCLCAVCVCVCVCVLCPAEWVSGEREREIRGIRELGLGLCLVIFSLGVILEFI